jgi:hypothetical protein
MNQITGSKVGTKINAFINGMLISKDCGTEVVAQNLYKQLLEAKANPTDSNLNKLLGSINANIRIAKVGGFEFDVETGLTYLKGFNTPVPKEIIETIEEYVENGYPTESIVNFWRLLMANPDIRIREDLFKFINQHDFSITDEGYLIVYKTVNYQNKVDNDLAEIVSNSYIKIKDSWKKSPAKYSVYKETVTTLSGEYKDVVVVEEYDEAYDEGMSYDEFFEEYGYEPEIQEEEIESRWVENEVIEVSYKVTETDTLSKWIEEGIKEIELLGTLDKMQADIINYNENLKSTYTDKYTQTMRIRLGEAVKMDRKDCNGDPKIECSYGLHVGATKYVERFVTCYSSDNKSPVLVCLVNPMNVIAVPEYDNSKMRVSEYFPFAKGTVDYENNNKISIIENKYFSSDYVSIEADELDKLIKLAMDGDDIRQTAIGSQNDDRDIEEYIEILKSRVLDLTF